MVCKQAIPSTYINRTHFSGCGTATREEGAGGIGQPSRSSSGILNMDLLSLGLAGETVATAAARKENYS